MKRSKVMMATFLVPAILSFVLVYLYPIIRTSIMSLFYVKNITDNVSTWKFVGLQNYVGQFQSSIFRTSLSNIFYIWLVGGIIILLLAMLFAVILTSGVRGKAFFRSVIYLPNIVSAVALATMWIQYVYSVKFGLFKTVFGALGLKRLAAIEWTSPDNILMAMVIAFCFGMIGYFMLIFMAGIEKIPVDYYEAATIEGANIFQKFTQITIPLMRGVLKTGIIWWSVNAMTFFIWSQMFSPRIPEIGTVTPMAVMYFTVFGRDFTVNDPKLINAGAGAAIGVILTLLVLFILFIVNRLIKDEELEF
jgi:ABC-type sugar transport system permease subunit